MAEIVETPYDGEDVQDCVDPTTYPAGHPLSRRVNEWMRAGSPVGASTKEEVAPPDGDG